MNHAALFIVILIVRVIIAASQAHAAKQGKPTPPLSTKARRVLRFVFLWVLAAPLAGYIALAPPRTLATYLPGGAVLLSALLWPLARYVLAPFGLVKPAYYVARAAWVQEERESLALLAASVALLRKSSFDTESAAWLEDRIQSATTLRGAGITASGIMALARGDEDGARVLFESVRTLDSRACGPAARHTAAEWLAASAAQRGAWADVIDIGADLVDAGRPAWLLAGVGKRLLGRPDAPTKYWLLFRWAFAPSRIAAWPIVERALSVPDGSPPVDEDRESQAPPAPVAPEGDRLARALAMHVRLLHAKKPTPAEIAAVGRAFDEALEDDSLARDIEDRAAFLGANRSTGLLSRLRDDVEEALFHLLKRHRIALDDTVDELGDTASAAQRRLRDEALAVIEALSDAVKTRVAERRALSPIDEWREFSALRMAYDRGVSMGGPELRYLAFTKVHGDVCAQAVWLFNERKEKPIANAMFRFLLSEAKAVGDAAGVELQTKNVACGV
ncbi:MAG: hypothetical protein U0441_09225 [Polyangiaceae bacterium]